MKVILRIIAQYFENYNTSGEGEPNWKVKGGHEFEVEVEEPLAMYSDPEDVKATIEILLIEQSNEMGKFEYLGHQFIPVKPTQLDSEVFNASLQELMNFKVNRSKMKSV